MIDLIATFFSIMSRLLFVYLIIINKSKNTISLMFSLSSIMSGTMWLYIFIQSNSTLLIARTSVELLTSLFSSLYILNNKRNS
jgi:lipid-A-disaccharide synthase-like uncharacterized protein